MSYEEIYETYQEVAKEHINRDLFNHSSEDAAETIEDIKQVSGIGDSLYEKIKDFITI